MVTVGSTQADQYLGLAAAPQVLPSVRSGPFALADPCAGKDQDRLRRRPAQGKAESPGAGPPSTLVEKRRKEIISKH